MPSFEEIIFNIAGSHKLPTAEREDFFNFVEKYRIICYKIKAREEAVQIIHKFMRQHNLASISFRYTPHTDSYEHYEMSKFVCATHEGLEHSTLSLQFSFIPAIGNNYVTQYLQIIADKNLFDIVINSTQVEDFFHDMIDPDEMQLYYSVENFEKNKLEDILTKDNKISPSAHKI